MLYSSLVLALPLLLLPEGAGDDAQKTDPGAAIAAIEAGEYVKARSILTYLLAEEGMSVARENMEAHQPLDALAPLDEVLTMDPRNSAAWCMRGEAALAAAEQGHQQAFLYGDALQSFERSLRFEPRPVAFLGAARAAVATSEFDKALTYARKGVAELDELGAHRPTLDVLPERTLADAAFYVYTEKKRAEEESDPYFLETEDSLRNLLGRTPEDAWAWKRLALLYQWEQLNEAVAETLGLGLDIAPMDQELHQQYVEALRTVGGRQAAVDAYAKFNAKHGGNALGIWYEAGQTVYLAIEELVAGQDATSTFEHAQELFRQCRGLEETYTDNCISYELICRNGIGWCRFNNEDYEGAEASFLSMEELKEGGLEWQLEGSLLSGVRGLEFVADRYAQKNDDPESLAKAASVFDNLRHYRPEDANFANNSGFFHRDAAVAMEVESMLARRDADTVAQTEEEKVAFLDRAEKRRARAQELMAKSYDAYVAASALAPDDVRVVNDTGLIMIYYVRTDAEAAEHYLNQAIAAAEVQIPALEAEVETARAAVAAEQEAASLEATAVEGEEATAEATPVEGPVEAPVEANKVSEALQHLTDLEDELDQLREAHGDAYENFGILYLTMTGDYEAAKKALQRCAEIGPNPRVPREWVKQIVLPICDEAIGGNTGDIGQLGGRVWLHVAANSSAPEGEGK